MGKKPVWTFGRFVWHELVTPDLARTRAFYAELVGWKYQDFGAGAVPYQMILAGGQPQGGLLSTASLTAEAAPAHVMGYVSVSDVGAAAEAAGAEGGQVLVAPFDVTGVGRLAVLADPLGATFSILHNSGGDTPPVGPPAQGQFSWDRLFTTDPARVASFYARVLGWQGEDRARLAEATAGLPTQWVSYLKVDDLAGARARVRRLGGEVVMDEERPPGPSPSALVRDAAGTLFGLTG